MKVLLLNQCFWPDVVATAQQLTDLAAGLSERGHQVSVIASRRGYDDAARRFARRERWKNVEIMRVPAINAGKKSRWRRSLSFASFIVACVVRLAFTSRQDVVVALTSPPLISYVASLFTRLKGGRLIFWVMDLNPDEAIAAGWLKPDSATAKFLESLLRSSMRHSEKIVVLDRFMKQRVAVKGIPEAKIETIPPWAHDNSVHYDRAGRDEFRRQHSLGDKFVVMYAGNHSPCHPLDTVLEAALHLSDREDIVFCFVGGGSELNKVKAFLRAKAAKNIRVLPYQPRAELAAMLSAADLQVVVMGQAFAGIVHPCKIYNILAIGSPLVYIGPTPSPIADIVARLPDSNRAASVSHGQSQALAELIRQASGEAGLNPQREPSLLATEFSRAVLMPRMIDEIESLCPAALEAEPAAANFQSA